MSEKRFEVIFYGDVINCVRDENGKEYNLHETITILNEQQATLNEQKEAIEYLKTVIRYTIPNQMVADVFKEIGEEYE